LFRLLFDHNMITSQFPIVEKDNFSPKVVATFREADEVMFGHDPALLENGQEREVNFLPWIES